MNRRNFLRSAVIAAVAPTLPEVTAAQKLSPQEQLFLNDRYGKFGQGLYLQQYGRALRNVPKGKTLILDFYPLEGML